MKKLKPHDLPIPVDIAAELRNIELFQSKLGSEVYKINGLLHILDERLSWSSSLENTKSITERNASIFIAQNYTLLLNALDLISKGYELGSLILIRPIAERIIMTIYFNVFPADLSLYLKPKGFKKFYSKLASLGYTNYLEGVLKRLSDEKDLWSSQWTNEIFQSLVEEPSRMLHMDIDYGLYSTVKSKKIHKQPLFQVRNSRVIVSKIRQASLWSLLALAVSQEYPLRYFEDIQIRHNFDEIYGTKTSMDIASVLDSPVY